MKISVRFNGEREVQHYEGAEARGAVRKMFKEITDQMLVHTPEGARQLRHWAADTLRQGRAIWSKMDEHGQPNGIVMTMEPPPLKVLGVIKEDGTFAPAEGMPEAMKAEIEKVLAEEKGQ